mgnify:CR=1 FL=1
MADLKKSICLRPPLILFCCLLFLLAFPVCAFAQDGAVSADDADVLNDGFSLSWVESDGEHVKEKDLFENERFNFVMPVKDVDGNAVDGVKFQIWNATTQTNETEVISADGKINLSLLKSHNYIFFPMDKAWQGKTYVWVKDGKLVSTKTLTKESLNSPTVWSYPEVTQVTLSKRSQALDNENDARRHTFSWYLKRDGNDIALFNPKVEFVSTLETVEGRVVTYSSGSTTIYASLLEDVDYMVIYKSPSGVTLGVEPFPVVYKDKSEYPEQFSQQWPVASTYDHRCCQQVLYFNVIPLSELGSTCDSISTDDGKTTVEGMDFTDEQSGRRPSLHTLDVTSQYKNLNGFVDYGVYSIKAENTARSEAFKVAGLDFKVTQKLPSVKTVKAVYEMNDDGSLSKLNSFTQNGDAVKFTTSTLSAKPVVFEYTSDAPAKSKILNLKVVDEDGNAVRGVGVELTAQGELQKPVISLPTTDAYGETARECDDTEIVDFAYQISIKNSARELVSETTVQFARNDTSGVYVDKINGQDYSGEATVVVKNVVDRSILKLKVTDGAGNPVEGVSLKLVPDADNVQHNKDSIILTTRTDKNGVLSKDISELINGSGETEYWTVSTTDSSLGEPESSAKLKADSVISIGMGEDGDNPGVLEYDIVAAHDGIPYSSKEYAGLVDLRAVKTSLVQIQNYQDHAQRLDRPFLIVENGSKIEAPELVTDGTPIAGWYTDPDFTNKWDFDNDVVSENMSLYPKWKTSLGLRVTRLAGDDCYGTNFDTLCQDVDNNGRPNGVIVCGTSHYLDSLSAAALSGLLDYPVLLVNGSDSVLNETSLSAIKMLTNDGANKIELIVLGGKFAISGEMESQLSAFDSDGSCERIFGDDGYSTNRAVYDFGLTRGSWNSDEVLIASGAGYHDALGAGGYAAAKNTFIFLANPHSDNSSMIAKAKNHSKATILGGLFAVSNETQAGLESAGLTTARLAGDDAYKTNVEFVKYALANGMSLNAAGFSSGLGYYDALGSSHILGKSRSVMFLISLDDSLNRPAIDMLYNSTEELTDGTVFGGEAVITQDFVNSIL